MRVVSDLIKLSESSRHIMHIFLHPSLLLYYGYSVNIFYRPDPRMSEGTIFSDGFQNMIGNEFTSLQQLLYFSANNRYFILIESFENYRLYRYTPIGYNNS